MDIRSEGGREGVAGRGVSQTASANNASGAFIRRAEARTKQGSGISATGFAAEKGLASGFAKGRSLGTAADPRGEAAMGERLADVMILLRDFFNKRPASTVLGCFRAQDFDRSGKFELTEFTLALKAFGFAMSDADYELVFNWFDQDGSGVVELKEFLNELRSEPNNSWTRVGIGRQRIPAVKHANMSQPPQGEELRYEGTSFTRECNYRMPLPAPTGAGVGEHKQVERVLATLRDFFQQRPNSVLLGCFREQDADGSGELELPELRRLVKRLGADEQVAARLLNTMDTDHDGTVGFAEFCVVVAPLYSTAGGQLRAAFDLFDTDGSGSLDRAEMAAIFSRLDVAGASRPEVMAKLFDEADADHDDKISFDEFCRYVNKAAAAGR